jgi:MoxR-like ATPase
MQLVGTTPTFTPPTAITLAEWDAARVDVDHVALPQRIVQELLRVRNDLKASGLVVSDRRWMALTRVLRAAAWLDDSPEVELDHLPVLKYGLWQKTDDRPRVVAALDTVDRSAVAKAVDLVDAGLRSYARRPTDPAEYLAALPHLADEITEAGKRVQEMLKGGVSRRAHGRIQPKLDELRKVHDALKTDVARKYAL